MKRKIGLVAGCSHSAGSEIDGEQDSQYNRDNSFGSLLCKKLGYEPINIAINGATNSGISRSILNWFEDQYDSETMEVFVSIGWTESSRLEVPALDRAADYKTGNPYIPWYDSAANSFYRINFGWEGSTMYERTMIPSYQKFMADNLLILETWAAKEVLLIEYFLKSLSIPYVMCSTMHMFQVDELYTGYTVQHIDRSRYYNLLTDQDHAFYWKYKNLGYSNDKAKYWHHSEIPHQLYADELYNFVKENQNV